jgi:hypothetical protein
MVSEIEELDIDQLKKNFAEKNAKINVDPSLDFTLILNNPEYIEKAIWPLIFRMNEKYGLKTMSSCSGHVNVHGPIIILKVSESDIYYFLSYIYYEFRTLIDNKINQFRIHSLKENLELLHGFKYDDILRDDILIIAPQSNTKFKNRKIKEFEIVIMSAGDYRTIDSLVNTFIRFRDFCDLFFSKYQDFRKSNKIHPQFFR